MILKLGRSNLRDLCVPMLWVALLAAVPRFYWMLTGMYNAVVIIFIAFAVLPFLLLDKVSRRTIGFIRIPVTHALAAFIIGSVAALAVYGVGYLLFGNTDHNWFAAIMKTFDKNNVVSQIRPNVFFFLLFSLPVMTFSPLGEEFFFRGLLHESVSAKFSPISATAIDAGFFGITHLAHYGLYLTGGTFLLLPSAFIWIVLMALASILFYAVKKYTGSIWGAVLCHSGFNFTMMATIFYVIR